MELITAEVIAGISGILVALISVWGAKQKVNLAAAEGELDSKRKSLSLKVDANRWSSVDDAIKALIQDPNNSIDRVLLLRGWNGWRDPHYATAVHQWRAEGQIQVDYLSVPLDKNYVNRMEDMHNNPPHVIDVDALKNILPWDLITRLYISEQIKHSVWLPVAKTEIRLSSFYGIFRWFGLKVRAVTFVSFATHDDEPISPDYYGSFEVITHMIRDAMVQ